MPLWLTQLKNLLIPKKDLHNFIPLKQGTLTGIAHTTCGVGHVCKEW